MSILPKNTPFTQVPNELIDTHLSKIKNSELKVYLLICRKTVGCQKRKEGISLVKMTQLTGLSKSTVVNAIKRLEEKRLIIKDTDQLTNHYGINIKRVEKSDHSTVEPQTVQKQNPKPVQKLDSPNKVNGLQDDCTTGSKNERYKAFIIPELRPNQKNT